MQQDHSTQAQYIKIIMCMGILSCKNSLQDDVLNLSLCNH